MALKIVKAEEPLTIEQVVIMVYGQPGIGKTTTAFSADAPICLDFDRGAHRSANRQDSVVVDRWEEVANLSAEELAEYNTVIVDTVGRALDALTAHLTHQNPKMAGPAGQLTLQGYGALKSTFAQWLKMLRQLGKDVILIAHDAEDKNGDDVIVRPDVQGGSRGEIIKSADAIGYIYRASKKTILDFNPTDRWIGKNPAACGPIEVPAIDTESTFMADTIQGLKDSINAMTDEQRERMEKLAEWRGKFEELESPEDFQKMIPRCAKAREDIRSEVKRMLVQVADAKGIAFNRPNKRFYIPEQEAGPDVGDGENTPGQED